MIKNHRTQILILTFNTYSASTTSKDLGRMHPSTSDGGMKNGLGKEPIMTEYTVNL